MINNKQQHHNQSFSLISLNSNYSNIENEELKKVYALVKPLGQLKLSEIELEEPVLKVLRANNPIPPQLTVRYCFKERCYKPSTQIDQLLIDFKIEGNYVHVDSDEAKIQFERIRTDPSVRDRYIKRRSMDVESTSNDEEEEDQSPSNKKKKKKKNNQTKTIKKIQKKFDLNSRSTQTMNRDFKDCDTMTESPPIVVFSDNATLDKIYDSYVEEKNKENELNNAKFGKGIKKIEKSQTMMQTKMKMNNNNSFEQIELIANLCKSALLLERIINQNTNEEIIHDFKFWEDKADDYRIEGSLMPLWKFNYAETKKLAVCSLAWVPKYPDAIVCGYGSFKLNEKIDGLIACYTLKNPSYPFLSFVTDFGCMSLDIHQVYSYLVAVGFFDGSIGIYSLLRKKSSYSYNIKNRYLCLSKNGNHRDPVWQIQWDKLDAYGTLALYSASSDGRIVRWTYEKNELYPSNIINLKQIDLTTDHLLGADLITGSVTCFEFNTQNDLLFLVGTEEGKVYCCTKGYYNNVMETFDSHKMCVFSVHWNPFYSKYFLSCSADWTIKLWELGLTEPLESFDLEGPVVDCAWAPFSSTVFAAITANGIVYFFDLNVNKLGPLCEQKVLMDLRSRKLTCFKFNLYHPIIIIGDDKGYVKCYKLSPNLRKKPKEIIRKDLILFEGEITKLERILSSFIDPDCFYKKYFKIYEIVRPKEIQQKKIETLSSKNDKNGGKKKGSDDDSDDDDESEKNND